MGNDMFNDEQLAFLELRQKETEEGLSWWKERALKAEAKLADKYLIEEQYETACGDRGGLLRMVETLREQKNALRSERDALRSRPAPPADAAREAVRMLRHLCNVYGCTSYGRTPDHGPDDCSWCEAEALLAALAPKGEDRG